MSKEEAKQNIEERITLAAVSAVITVFFFLCVNGNINPYDNIVGGVIFENFVRHTKLWNIEINISLIFFYMSILINLGLALKTYVDAKHSSMCTKTHTL